MGKTLFLSALAGLALPGVLALSRGEPQAAGETPRLRRPVALCLSPDGRSLFVANRAGSVSVLDVASRRVVGEVAVGQRLADLTALADGSLLAADEAAGQVVVLTPRDGTLQVQRRVPVAATPVCVRADADGRRWYVASLWPRQVTIVDDGDRQRVLDLPFAPRLLQPLPGNQKLLIADAFGGQLAVADTATAKLDRVQALDAHAVRGVAVHGDRVLLAHQVLVPRTPTTAEEMHWGNVAHQGVRSLPLANLRTSGMNLLRDSDLYALGEPGRGAGDPAGLAVAANGTIVVTLGGVGEVLFGKDLDVSRTRLKVGRRPTAVVLSPDGKHAFVADTFGDAVVIVDPGGHKVEATVSLGKQPKLTAEDSGEMFFYDARLSHEGWLSCHSCHTDGHSNGGLSDTLSDGGFGAPKRVLTLLGVKDTGPWTWVGGSPDLTGQVSKSLRVTMRGARVTDNQVRDITAYLRTLSPPPPVRNPDVAAVRRGHAVFDRHGCAKCHAPPLYTTAKTYDVGLHDEAGNRMFNPPSLRGVARAGPYLHDGRAATLEDVFVRFGHPGPAPLPPGEVGDLTTFLRSL